MTIEEESYNSRKKLNLRGANSPPVAPSDVKKIKTGQISTLSKIVFLNLTDLKIANEVYLL